MISAAIQPIFALFVSKSYQLFGEPDPHEQKQRANIYAGSIFCIGLLAAIVDFLSSFSFVKPGEQMTMRMRRAIFAALLRSRSQLSRNARHSPFVRFVSVESRSPSAHLLSISSSSSGSHWYTCGSHSTSHWCCTDSIHHFLCSCMEADPRDPLLCSHSHAQRRPTRQQTCHHRFYYAGRYANQAMTHIRTVMILRREHYLIEHYESAF